MISELSLLNTSLLIIGDFNLHFDNVNDSTVSKSQNILDSYSLYQHVKTKSHKRGHILDLVISEQNSQLINTLEVTTDLLSDHYPIVCDINLESASSVEKEIMSRKLKDIDVEQFASSIKEAVKCIDSDDPLALLHRY
ncbi:hypothetical protein SNE40_009656 [Patella caerulea]|uniref:Endonuclease/exonuclease/phosphatase domain-containing protein n=1 Tax=Patella caerulea TaxID=87958 RepID=A0AAN8JVY8_PATCE